MFQIEINFRIDATLYTGIESRKVKSEKVVIIAEPERGMSYCIYYSFIIVSITILYIICSNINICIICVNINIFIAFITVKYLFFICIIKQGKNTFRFKA